MLWLQQLEESKSQAMGVKARAIAERRVEPIATPVVSVAPTLQPVAKRRRRRTRAVDPRQIELFEVNGRGRKKGRAR